MPTEPGPEGLRGGLGSSLNDLAVLLGGALTYNQNLALTAGIALKNRLRLNSRYSVGDTIRENLESERLDVERLRPSLYFGIALRLGANPFTRTTPETRGTAPIPSPETDAHVSEQKGQSSDTDRSSPRIDPRIR